MEYKEIEPIVKKLSDKSAFWQKDYKTFKVCVYKPFSPLNGNILNYGFSRYNKSLTIQMSSILKANFKSKKISLGTQLT